MTVMKEGTLHSDTNFQPWKHYSPCMAWLGALWDAKKLSHKSFLALSAEFRTGHSNRKRDADDVAKQELELAVEEHVAAQLVSLNAVSPLQQFRQFAEIDSFVKSFKEPRWRRPILLLVDGTNTGKSLLGAHVLREVAKVLDVCSHVEVTVEADEALDFSSFDHRLHAGVLLDGVGDTMTLWRHREMLQGRPKTCWGGRSATMMYAYPFTLARRAVVVTMDLTAQNLYLLKTNHWLKDQRNVCCLSLTAPSWTSATSLPVVVLQQADHMKTWGVLDVVAFFEREDAQCLARTMQLNAVTGSDLLAFAGPQQLMSDLRMTPFASRKVISLRDTFLAS